MSWCSFGGSRTSQIKTQHCWGLLGTVVTIWEPGLALCWDRGGGTGAATTSEPIRVFSLFLSYQLYESHPKNRQVIPFPADSGTGQQPPTTASYSIKTGVGVNSSKQPCWGAMWVSICCTKIHFFFCFKSRKHCAPKTMKVSMSKIKVVHSMVQLILPNGISSFCHLLTFSCSTWQPECSFKIALCVQ